MVEKSVTVSDQEKLKLLSDLIAIQSVNGHEKAVADYIAHYFDQHGIAATLVLVAPDRVNLVASIGEGQPTIVLSGHMDVVSPVEPTRWQTDPFKFVKKRSSLWTRNCRYEGWPRRYDGCNGRIKRKPSLSAWDCQVYGDCW